MITIAEVVTGTTPDTIVTTTVVSSIVWVVYYLDAVDKPIKAPGGKLTPDAIAYADAA